MDNLEERFKRDMSMVRTTKETLEEAAENYEKIHGGSYSIGVGKAFKFGAQWQAERILEFLYSEITERRDYSASKMCEKVIEFIEQNKKK